MGKQRMIIGISRYGMNITYTCYNGVTRYGKKCTLRDDSSYCMRCKYCKAEMSARDATRLLNSYGKKV